METANAIFSRPAGTPRTIFLEFEDEVLKAFSVDGKDPVLGIYLTIALAGIKKLYGQERDFTTLTKDEFNVLQKYMNSMGVSLLVVGNEEGSDPWTLVERGEPVPFLRISVEFL